MEGMLSPADVAVLSGNTGNNGGFGDGNSAWWIIILVVLLGWGRNGFGGNGNGNGGSEGHAYYPFGAPDIFGKLDGISNGLCDGFYRTAEQVYGIQNTLCQGFSGVNQNIVTNGYETRGAINDIGYRLQDCCCKTQRSIDNVRFENAQNTCALNNSINLSTRDILENNNCNTRAILDFLTKDKIDTLQAENTALKFQASQNAQNSFITANQTAQTAELIRRLGADCPQPAYLVNAPTPVNFPTNCCGQVQFSNCGCGCNNY